MDPIADMLTIIRNAQAVNKETVKVSYSRIKFKLAQILAREGFIEDVEERRKKVKSLIIIKLKYASDGSPSISNIKRISTPGQRIYVKFDEIQKVKGGYGKVIISTSRGLMEGGEARKQKLGGEHICNLW